MAGTRAGHQHTETIGSLQAVLRRLDGAAALAAGNGC
jgi:hypothetical protein